MIDIIVGGPCTSFPQTEIIDMKEDLELRCHQCLLLRGLSDYRERDEEDTAN